MKNRIGVVSLAAACLILAIALIVLWTKSSKRERDDADSISNYSNRWVKTSADLDDQRQVAASLYKDRDEQKKAYTDLTNNFSKLSDDFSLTSSNLAKSETDLKSTRSEVSQRDTKITELESQNQALDKQATDLTASLTNLTFQIAETQRKLAASEGDKAFLEKELKRLMAEKAELERQFNDLTVLRAQVGRLKEELSIARRLEWIRQGLFESAQQKGGQRLMQGEFGVQQAKAARTPKPAYDLNVEVSADGSVKVIPPDTNASGALAPAK